MHFPTLPNSEFTGRTGNGDWADCLAKMDYQTGQAISNFAQKHVGRRGRANERGRQRRRPPIIADV
jgi:hypothetical protein